MKATPVPGGVMTLSRYMLDQARVNTDYQVRLVAAAYGARASEPFTVAGPLCFRWLCGASRLGIMHFEPIPCDVNEVMLTTYRSAHYTATNFSEM